MSTVPAGPMTPEQLESALRAIGAERYHDKHPFHHMLHGGRLNKGQVQAWALNRYCYQAAVPRKDAALMSRALDRELRREWRHRIEDHDGGAEEAGGIERWLVLTTGLGLDRDYVISMKGALPATRFAVEAYVRFVREETLLEAVASSLTELFAPTIHRERIVGMLESYDFISDHVMQYFRRRLDQATVDADFALAYVKEHARTPEQQAAVLDALRFKCNVLWAQLDACHFAYVEPGLIPPGAFVPDGFQGYRPPGQAEGALSESAAMNEPPRIRLTISAASKVVLVRHARLRHDPVQDRWVLLVPEKVLHPSETAVEVLKLCDGVRSVRDVAEALSVVYEARSDAILADIVPLLQDLADKGYVTA